MENQTGEGYHPLQQPEEIPLREREDAMGAYLMMFAAIGAGLPLPIINLIAVIIYYFLNRSKSRFVHFHSLQALLTQLPTSILNAVLVFWTARRIFDACSFKQCPHWNEYVGFFWLVIIANLFYFVFNIVAAIRARQGRMYYFLFFGKLSYQKVYSMKAGNVDAPIVNAPPKL